MARQRQPSSPFPYVGGSETQQPYSMGGVIRSGNGSGAGLSLFDRKVTVPHMVEINGTRTTQYNNRLSDLRSIFDSSTGYIHRQTLRSAGFTIRDIEGEMYAFDMKARVLINLENEGFDIRRLQFVKNPVEDKNKTRPSDESPVPNKEAA